MTRSILLIPNDEHRDALLAPGLCGARVPGARFEHIEGRPGWSGVMRSEWVPALGGIDATALVLAWKGQPAPLGIARLREITGYWPDVNVALKVPRLDGADAARVFLCDYLGTIEVIDHD